MGLSLGHIILLLLVGIIVVGPKNLPSLMRTAGQWVGRLRRMSMDLRSQSGIDDLLRQEGLDQHIHELRSLSRFNMVETLIAPAAATPTARPDAAAAAPEPAEPRPRPFAWNPQEPLRAREYPVIGCDSYGAVPDDMPVPASPYVPEDAPAERAPEVAAAAEPAAPSTGEAS